MSSSSTVFIVIGVSSALAVAINIVCLILERNSLTSLQRFVPWLLSACVVQTLRVFVVAGGETDLALRVFDAGEVLTLFLCYTYFVAYVLQILKQAYFLRGQKMNKRIVYSLYVGDVLLLVVGIVDVIVKNILGHTLSTGIQRLFFYGFTLFVVIVFNYAGIRLVRIVQISTQNLQKQGVQIQASANLWPLKKTLGFFTLMSLLGLAILPLEMIGHLRAPSPFPAPLDLSDDLFAGTFALTMVLASLQAWFHLDSCQKRSTTSGRASAKQSSGSKKPPSNTQNSRNSNSARPSHGDQSDDDPPAPTLFSEPGTAEPTSPALAPGEGADLPPMQLEIRISPPSLPPTNMPPRLEIRITPPEPVR